MWSLATSPQTRQFTLRMNFFRGFRFLPDLLLAVAGMPSSGLLFLLISVVVVAAVEEEVVAAAAAAEDGQSSS